jgi:hypothetical protein
LQQNLSTRKIKEKTKNKQPQNKTKQKNKLKDKNRSENQSPIIEEFASLCSRKHIVVPWQL